MLIDADDLGPRRESCTAPELKLAVIGVVDVASRATKLPPDLFKIAEGVTSKLKLPVESLGVASALFDTRNRFSEWLAAVSAPEPSFFDDERNPRATNGGVNDPNLAMIVDGPRRVGALRANLDEILSFLAEQAAMAMSQLTKTR